METNGFKPYVLQPCTSERITIEFLYDAAHAALLIKIKGVLPTGSMAAGDCRFIRQEISAGLIAAKPVMILLDLSQLVYDFGLGIADALSPFTEIDLYDGEGFKIAYLISDLNKAGLSSLWGFNIDKPRHDIFYDFDKAYQYIKEEYEKI